MQFFSNATEIKSVTPSGEFVGYASIFNNIDRQGDIIEVGAFKEMDLTHDGMIRVLHSHQPTKPIGKAKVTSDNQGLHVAGRLNLNVSEAKDMHALMMDHTVSSMSIGFDILPNGAAMKNGVRHLSALKLWEVSPVAFAANPEARIQSVKSAAACADIREFEAMVKSSLGLSNRQAKKLAAGGWQALIGDEPETEEERITERLDELTQLLRGGYERPI